MRLGWLNEYLPHDQQGLIVGSHNIARRLVVQALCWSCKLGFRKYPPLVDISLVRHVS